MIEGDGIYKVMGKRDVIYSAGCEKEGIIRAMGKRVGLYKSVFESWDI